MSAESQISINEQVMEESITSFEAIVKPDNKTTKLQESCGETKSKETSMVASFNLMMYSWDSVRANLRSFSQKVIDAFKAQDESLKPD